MTSLIYNISVEKELNDFYKEFESYQNLKIPIDFPHLDINYESISLFVTPKYKKSIKKTKKDWNPKSKNSKGLF